MLKYVLVFVYAIFAFIVAWRMEQVALKSISDYCKRTNNQEYETLLVAIMAIFLQIVALTYPVAFPIVTLVRMIKEKRKANES